MKFKPLHAQVVIKRIRKPEFTAGGLALPDDVPSLDQARCGFARVLEVGPGEYVDSQAGLVRRPMSVSKGDIVLVPPYGGYEVSHPDVEKEVCVIGETEVVAVVMGCRIVKEGSKEFAMGERNGP
jgi:co-chaperonin GroES (HSP10)